MTTSHTIWGIPPEQFRHRSAREYSGEGRGITPYAKDLPLIEASFDPCALPRPLLWISRWMNRLCPTFPRVGVSYQPARLTFSRRSHPLARSAPRRRCGRCWLYICPRSRQKSGCTTTQKSISTIASFRLGKQNHIAADAKPRQPPSFLYVPMHYAIVQPSVSGLLDPRSIRSSP